MEYYVDYCQSHITFLWILVMLCYVAMIIINNIDTQNDTYHNIIGPCAYNINAVLGFYIDQYVQLGCLFELA